MPVEIRKARPSDVAALVGIENAVFEADRISPKGFRDMIGSRSSLLLVADDGDVLAGYCAILFRANSRKARLYSIAAAPGRKGIGRDLLAAAEEAARLRNALELRLEVRADNGRAIALYERAGFRMFGKIDGYYADGAAALRFSKALSPSAAGERIFAGTLIP